MSSNINTPISRRNFLKWSGAATAATVVGTKTPVLHALVPSDKKADASNAEYHFSACDMCLNKCGLVARVENNVVTKLDPNQKFLKSRGMLCARGNAGIAQLYDPDRLKYPLLRKGKRGEGKWQRLSWDEALDYAAEQLKKIADEYTRCGVLFSPGSDMQSTFVHWFAEVFGSYNVTTHESACLLSRNRAYLDTFGEVPFSDVLHTKYIIMAGANRYEALITPDSIDLMSTRKNGTKLVVLDPRYTKTAALADEWYPVRPGTDMAFFLAIIHVIISEKLYDQAYAFEKLYGLEQLSEHVKQYSPEWAEGECEIPAKDITRIARELAAAAPAAIVYPGRRTSDYVNSTQIRRSMAILNALLGNWDRPGGLLAARQVGLSRVELPEAPFYEDNPDDRLDIGKAHMMFEEEGSFKHMRDAIIEAKPYPIKGWFVYKHNPLQSEANRQRTLEMMEKLDFILTVDIAMSDTAWMSDLVLPAPSYLERQDPASGLQGSSACACVVTRNPVVPALFESKPVFEILKELANRLELGEYFDFTLEEYRKQQLKNLPDAERALREDGVYYNPSKLYGVYEGRIYKTKSKKIELYNERYAEMGVDPMPVYKSPRKVPSGRFRMVVGRNAYFTHCTTQNNALLHELMPENSLWIHPKAAAGLGIKEGDLVEVSSAVGRGELKASLKDGIREDTVYMASGFGVLSKGLTNIYGKGACMAEILEDFSDELSGNMAMHETFVKVARKVA
ncbi:MAG: molybdopterin-dependent oxidoreductase [Deltaproteobacteria bacterium]|nr:MAG: molybdopterin-dependent oxidoreductase [Deltaproteobacteria bacterium]